MTIQAAALSSIFAQQALPQPAIQAAPLPGEYRSSRVAIEHMMKSLHELGAPEDRLSAEEVAGFVDTLGGAGQDARYQVKMSGVRDSILGATAPDGSMTIRKFAEAMALGGNSIPGTPPSETVRHVAADSLANAGIAPTQKLVNGLAKLGEAVSAQVREQQPALRAPKAAPFREPALVAA